MICLTRLPADKKRTVHSSRTERVAQVYLLPDRYFFTRSAEQSCQNFMMQMYFLSCLVMYKKKNPKFSSIRKV